MEGFYCEGIGIECTEQCWECALIQNNENLPNNTEVKPTKDKT